MFRCGRAKVAVPTALSFLVHIWRNPGHHKLESATTRRTEWLHWHCQAEAQTSFLVNTQIPVTVKAADWYRERRFACKRCGAVQSSPSCASGCDRARNSQQASHDGQKAGETSVPLTLPFVTRWRSMSHSPLMEEIVPSPSAILSKEAPCDRRKKNGTAVVHVFARLHHQVA